MPSCCSEAGRVATGLRRMGILPGDRIALLCGNRPEFVSHALWRALKIGAIVVPLDIRLRAAEIAYIAGNCEAALIAHARTRWRAKFPRRAELPGGCLTLAIPDTAKGGCSTTFGRQRSGPACPDERGGRLR